MAEVLTQYNRREGRFIVTPPESDTTLEAAVILATKTLPRTAEQEVWVQGLDYLRDAIAGFTSTEVHEFIQGIKENVEYSANELEDKDPYQAAVVRGRVGEILVLHNNADPEPVVGVNWENRATMIQRMMLNVPEDKLPYLLNLVASTEYVSPADQPPDPNGYLNLLLQGKKRMNHNDALDLVLINSRVPQMARRAVHVAHVLSGIFRHTVDIEQWTQDSLILAEDRNHSLGEMLERDPTYVLDEEHIGKLIEVGRLLSKDEMHPATLKRIAIREQYKGYGISEPFLRSEFKGWGPDNEYGTFTLEEVLSDPRIRPKYNEDPLSGKYKKRADEDHLRWLKVQELMREIEDHILGVARVYAQAQTRTGVNGEEWLELHFPDLKEMTIPQQEPQFEEVPF